MSDDKRLKELENAVARQRQNYKELAAAVLGTDNLSASTWVDPIELAKIHRAFYLQNYPIPQEHEQTH